jgi:hypothetical protein
MASSGQRRKGTGDFRRLNASPLDSLDGDDPRDTGNLRGWTTDSGVASMDGGLRSSGEIHRWCCRGLREVERNRGAEKETRVRGELPVIFIAQS